MNDNDISECIACGYQGKWSLWRRFPDFLYGIPFVVMRCPVCGLGRTVPSPQMNIKYYEVNCRYDTLFTEKYELYRLFSLDLLETLRGILEPQGKKLLDVGCGGGFLVESAEQLGFYAEGIDANKRMIDFGKSRGLNLYQANAMDISFSKPNRYDVVVLSAILEHLSAPSALLQHIRANLLKEDGVILVSQASYDGLLPSIFSWGWYGWQPKEHFWHFTPSSFEKLAKRAGFKIVSMKRNSLYHPWFFKGQVIDLVGRNLAALLARLGHFMGRGDNFYMVLQPCSDLAVVSND